MTRRGPHGLFGSLAAVVLLAAGPAVRACPVCTGNPESPLTHGAQQGILTMLIITYGVLIGLFGMLAFVIFRARRRHIATSRPCLRNANESRIGAPSTVEV